MFSVEKKRNTLIVRIDGELDHNAAGRMRAKLDTLIDESHARRLIFDLNGLRFMDSSGVGLILGRCKRMSRHGGSVAVSGYDSRTDRIFEMSGVYQMVERLV